MQGHSLVCCMGILACLRSSWVPLEMWSNKVYWLNAFLHVLESTASLQVGVLGVLVLFGGWG
jgi:hypothetical protein